MAAVLLLRGNVGDVVTSWVLTEIRSTFLWKKRKRKENLWLTAQPDLEERYSHHFWDSKLVVVFFRGDMCNSSHVSTTHVIMEGFRFAGVVTCLSPLWGSTIQVPEYAVDKTGHEANRTTQTTPGHVYVEITIPPLTTTRNGGIQGALRVLCFSPIESWRTGLKILFM